MFGTARKLTTQLNPRRFSPTDAIFPDIDATALANDLKLAARGRSRGAEEQPVSDLATLDPIESEIVEKVGEHRRRGLNAYDEHMRVYRARLAEALDAKARIEAEGHTARGDFVASAKIWDDHVAHQRAMLEDRVVEYGAFRRDHGLKERTARNPGSLMFTIGLILLMIVVESILNGYFFAQSNAFGLFGGSMVAFVISIVNVGVSLWAGWFGRYAVHRRISLKVIGLIVILVWAVAAAGFNLGVGHFRDVADGRPWDDAVVAALSNFLARPVDLRSIESWLLVFWGGLIAFAALYKGFHLDDPYPGFGRVARQLQQAREDYAVEMAAAHDDLLEKRDEAKERLEDAGVAARTQINDALDAAFARQGLSGHLGAFLGHCDEVADRLLGLYRDANASARQTPAPPHFADRHRFPLFAAPEDTETQRVKATEAVAKIETAVEAAVRDIFAAFDKAVETHAPVRAVEERAMTRHRRSADEAA